jgi:hypothetical protein
MPQHTFLACFYVHCRSVNYVEGLVEVPSVKCFTGTDKVRKNFGAPDSMRFFFQEDDTVDKRILCSKIKQEG